MEDRMARLEQRMDAVESFLLGKPGEPGLDEVARTMDVRVSRIESIGTRTFWLLAAVAIEAGVALVALVVRTAPPG